MENKKIVVTTIDQYISDFPKDIQDILQRVRETIKSAAPDATETIKYAMPTFLLYGNLIHFAAYKNHIGVYPVPSGDDKFNQEVAPFIKSKGTLQFPLDKPIPYDLIKKTVAFRIMDTQKKAATK
jgi:uncharacterized protein YdhG (YjbR/CyaY superfamily)